MLAIQLPFELLSFAIEDFVSYNMDRASNGMPGQKMFIKLADRGGFVMDGTCIDHH